MKRLVLAVLLLSSVAFADLKLRVHVQRGTNPVRESVRYAKGQRTRIETRNLPLVTLIQCDQRRRVLLNPATKTYLVVDFSTVENEFERDAAAPEQTARRCGGTVKVQQKITELGEPVTIQGVTAHHLHIVATFEPDANSCHRESNSVNDGWYGSLGQPTGCRVDEGVAGITGPSYVAGDHYVREGDRMPTDYVALRTTAEQLFDGAAPDPDRIAIKREVVDISTAALPDSLFEIPPDYREVKTRAGLFPPRQKPASATGASSAPAGTVGHSAAGR